MKKLLFIYNPKSGQKAISSHLSNIIEYFSKNGYLTTCYASQAQDDARKKVRQVGGSFDEIIISGGDGTLDEVVSGTIKAKNNPIIGYIPTGSTNDFAKSIKVPTDIEKAKKIAINGKVKDLDVGVFNGKYFTYVAAFGSFAEVSYETDQNMKNIFGRFAYILEGVKSVSNLKSYKAKITVDDEVISGEFIHLMITNSVSVGGFTGFYDNVSLDDGVFESVIVKKPTNIFQLNKIIDGLRTSKESDFLLYRNGKKFKIESDEQINWTLDGDYGGSCEVCEVVVKNKAFKIRTGLK